jgi:hypothetical protein
LRVFQNRIIFVPKRAEVTEGWRKYNTEELHTVYSSKNVIGIVKFWDDEIGRTCSMLVGYGKCIQNFGCKA